MRREQTSGVGGIIPLPGSAGWAKPTAMHEVQPIRAVSCADRRSQSAAGGSVRYWPSFSPFKQVEGRV